MNIDYIDMMFWWVGVVVSSTGAIAMALASFLAFGYFCLHIVTNYRAAKKVKCVPHKYFDFWLYRKLYHFKYAVGFAINGVPTEMIAKDGAVVFDIEWLKE